MGCNSEPWPRALSAVMVFIIAQACLTDIEDPEKSGVYACSSSSHCMSGYDCIDGLCVRRPSEISSASCANLVVETEKGEECDDGHLQSGDGCSESCRVEHGFTCKGEPSECG